MTGGDDARFGLLMGSLGIKLVGRARPLDYLARLRGSLHARGIKLPKDVVASATDAKVCHLYLLYCALKVVLCTPGYLPLIRSGETPEIE